MAGRLTLIKYVLSPTLNYHLQTTLLPAAVIQRLEQALKGFLWGDTENQKHVHLLSWEKVTKTKQQGGLGIRDIKLNNEAFLTNQAWRIWTNPNGIWAKFLKQRHFPNTHFLNLAISTYGSHSWKAILKGRSILSKGTCWIVGNGQSTKFWTDPWLPNCTLRTLIHGPLMPGEDHTKVSDVLAPNSQWNLNPLSFDLPMSIIKQIQATSFSDFNVTQDKLI